jgi:hypothetical protein
VRHQPDVVVGTLERLDGCLTVDHGRHDLAVLGHLLLPDDHIWLMPHNPAYTPIPGNDAEILGKVVAVLRRV